MITLDQYYLKTITADPEWPIFKSNLAGAGLVPIISELGTSITMVEIGICLGINSYMLLESCPNIKKLIGVDHYKSYRDWDRDVPQYEQDRNFVKLSNNLPYLGPRFELIKKSSRDAAQDIPDDSCEFIFIDADHSMKAVLGDLDLYWPKLKTGGIMAGHDGNLWGVSFAVTSWTKKKGIDHNKISTSSNNTWYFTKD